MLAPERASGVLASASDAAMGSAARCVGARVRPSTSATRWSQALPILQYSRIQQVLMVKRENATRVPISKQARAPNLVGNMPKTPTFCPPCRCGWTVMSTPSSFALPPRGLRPRPETAPPSPPRWQSYQSLSPTKERKSSSPPGARARGRLSPPVDVSDELLARPNEYAMGTEDPTPRGSTAGAPRFELSAAAIVRTDKLLTSRVVITLPVGTECHVVDVARLPDGSQRVQIVLVGQRVPLGWVTARRASNFGDGARSKGVSALRQLSREDQRRKVEEAAEAAEAARLAAEAAAAAARADAEGANEPKEAININLASLRAVTAKELPMVMDIWKALDVDKSGTISIDEFVSGLQKAFPNALEEDMHALFEECDRDGNGELVFDELAETMRRVQRGRYGQLTDHVAEKGKPLSASFK